MLDDSPWAITPIALPACWDGDGDADGDAGGDADLMEDDEDFDDDDDFDDEDFDDDDDDDDDEDDLIAKMTCNALEPLRSQQLLCVRSDPPDEFGGSYESECAAGGRYGASSHCGSAQTRRMNSAGRTRASVRPEAATERSK